MENTDNSFDEFFGAFEGEDGNQTDTAEEMETSGEATEDAADEPENEPEGAETAGEVTEDKAEEDGAQGNDKGEGGTTEQKFIVKVNKENREVSYEDAPAWIQKGMDYDRVKGQLDAERQNSHDLQAKLDQQQEYMDVLNLISEKVKAPISELLEQLHINAVKGPDQTEAEARALIRAEKAERMLKASTEKQGQQTQEQEQKADDGVARAQREIAEFRQQFPDAKLDNELMEKLKPDIQAGMSLTSAYLKQENARQAAQIAEMQKQQAADAQNKKNRAKAPGSQRDSGGQRTRDAYDDFFDAFEK